MKCSFCHNLTISPSKISNLINIMIFQVVVVAGFTPVEEYRYIFGGFGGGGGARGWWRGGGGGGYSGGGSGDNAPDTCGGGGGSFNVGNNQQNECCYNKAGHGQVTITLL